MLCAAFFLSNSPARAAEENTAAVRAASNQFYAALNKLFTGDMAPMDAIWSHRKDVTYMEGCGRLGPAVPTAQNKSGWAPPP